MLDKLNYKKGILCFGLAGMIFQAQAEILVILPESGPMARAGNSIKQGIVSAQQSSVANIQLKFVNSDQKNIKDLLKKNVSNKTQMVIGPLARAEVESLIQENPKFPVLALNQVALQNPNVLQFGLSKDEDALALIATLAKDKINKVYVIRQPGTEAESLTFVNALYKKFKGDVAIVDQVPSIRSKEGVLLLGNNTWLNQLPDLPSKNIYVQAISIEYAKSIPKGLKFCDVPALYQAQWQQSLPVSLQNLAEVPYQRLYAFGLDAWDIAEKFVLNPEVKSLKLNGRTGQIRINNNTLQRIPQCFENTRKGLVAI